VGKGLGEDISLSLCYALDIMPTRPGPQRGQNVGTPLPDEKRWLIVHTYRRCFSIKETSKRCKCSKRTIRRWVNRHSLTGKVTDTPRPGRRKVVSSTAASKALDLFVGTSRPTASEVALELHKTGVLPTLVSKSTIIRHARAAAESRDDSLHCFLGKPPKGLTSSTKEKRLAFALKYINFNWNNTMFTDRKRFYLRYPGSVVTGASWVLGSQKKTRQDGVFQPSKPDCLNIYAGITRHGGIHATEVVGTKGYKVQYKTKKGSIAKNITTQQYEHVVEDFLFQGQLRFKNNQKWLMQQDNDPTHRIAKWVIQQHNDENGSLIQLLEDWPPNSPDLNLIENFWSWVQHKVNKMGFKTFKTFKQGVKDLIVCTSDETLRYLATLFDSMPRRLARVIELEGGKTEY
jgi:hypothetical protein